MAIRCPDTMVLVSVINSERERETCKKQLSDAHELILFQCILIEVTKVCAREYFDTVTAFYSDCVRRKFLEKYEKDSVIHKLVSRNEYTNQLEEMDKLLNDLPSNILKLILCYDMKIFPNPFGSVCSVLEDSKSMSTELKDFIRKILRLPLSFTVNLELEGYIQKYGLEKYVEEAKRSLYDKLWGKLESDKYALATYLRAKEIWSSLEILTRDRAIFAASKESPDKFSVFYF